MTNRAAQNWPSDMAITIAPDAPAPALEQTKIEPQLSTFAQSALAWLVAYDELQEDMPGARFTWPEIFIRD